MKHLKEQVSLRGQLEEITMMELRKSPGEVLSLVELGMVFVIKRNGKLIATLSSLPGTELITVIGGNGRVKNYKNPERGWA